MCTKQRRSRERTRKMEGKFPRNGLGNAKLFCTREGTILMKSNSSHRPFSLPFPFIRAFPKKQWPKADFFVPLFFFMAGKTRGMFDMLKGPGERIICLGFFMKDLTLFMFHPLFPLSLPPIFQYLVCCHHSRLRGKLKLGNEMTRKP